MTVPPRNLKLKEQEEQWLTTEVLRIYHNARSTQEESAVILADVLQWRIEKRKTLSSLQCAACLEDPCSHDARFFGTDAEGDLIFSNCFALPRNLSPDAITTHMMCLFERTLRRHPAPDTGMHRRWSWVIDLYGFGLRHMDPRTSVKLLHLLQTAYRARLKHLLIVDAPFGFWGLWKAVSSFIKPATSQLIEFVDWSSAPDRYRELFGEDVTRVLLKEGAENRDETNRPKKKWVTFYGEGCGMCDAEPAPAS